MPYGYSNSCEESQPESSNLQYCNLLQEPYVLLIRQKLLCPNPAGQACLQKALINRADFAEFMGIVDKAFHSSSGFA